ncbi:class II aldolase/adducin family protein [Ferribacterium limneticum]|uniref:class II aldolase/adducin family protein n=1 Tax=Ferribacterium limneticum TaxID=76259 RepID=UPI001CFBBBFE|nr:class II aldolase/adducin family protein [Ferribacterium limneticum]UCV17840.1 class II aldolase/adducin family protein [Ferribacterium limneticum]
MNFENNQVVVRKMARALARGGLANAYGHCSVRMDEHSFLVCAAQSPGLIKSGEAGSVVPVVGDLPEGVLGEVRMHQQIYQRRPEVRAICRFISPNVLALSAMGYTPKARHGFGSYFYPQVPFWPDPALIRNDQAANGVAQTMGGACAVVVGCNGAVTAGETPEQALTLAWFLEDAARVELAVLAAGMADKSPLMSEDQARNRATWQGRIAERMWDYLTAGDPE